MALPNLQTITVKPTLGCTARCACCECRLQFYGHRESDGELPLALWKRSLTDASVLGASRVIISGGEPSLYPHLAELVEAIGELGMTSKLNTNGSRLDSHLVSRLSKAGLSEATVSIYSHDPLVHDSVRNEDGLFSRAVRAIDLLKEQSAITVGMQTVLARHNLLDLDKLLGLAYQMNVAYLQVSYVEGGSQAWLPSANQIDLFHSEVAPRMVERIRQKGRRQSLRAIAVVSHLLSGERNAEFSAGNYFPDRRPRCRRPFSFALLLANGDVLPCSGAEYCQGPVMGNLSTEALGLMWCSEAWKAFRKARHGWCHRCPVTLHSRIPLV